MNRGHGAYGEFEKAVKARTEGACKAGGFYEVAQELRPYEQEVSDGKGAACHGNLENDAYRPQQPEEPDHGRCHR